MKIIGIICEYNPFHLGHKYQIDKIRSLEEDCLIIALCSSCFTQRGDVSVVNKWDKAEVALNNGIDLFIEFPFAYATQSADIFAKGAVEILNKLKIDTLVFGSESFEADDLELLAQTALYNKDYNVKVQEYLSNGYNYATSLSKTLYDITGIMIDKPNDLLGLSYVKEIIKNGYKIKPVTIKRVDNYHNDEVINNIASASYIRKLLSSNLDISKYVPNGSDKYINNVNIESFFPYLKYQIITNKDNLAKFLTVDEGIENRILKYIGVSDSFKDLVMNIKCKRYTYNKINRMLIHILVGFTKEEAKNIKVDYVRVLGFNAKGQDYLHKIKKDIKIVTNYKRGVSLLLDIEYRVTTIYALVLNNDLDKQEFSHKPIIKK